MKATEKLTLDTEGIPIGLWGKDHWSTLAYIETICVENRDGLGMPKPAKIQTNLNRHPELAFMSVTPFGSQLNGEQYGIRLAGGVELPGTDYDEWDCIEDMCKAHLVLDVGFTGSPAFRLTALGSAVAAKVRAYKATGGNFGEMRMSADDLRVLNNSVGMSIDGDGD